jgi:hypothetical protein
MKFNLVESYKWIAEKDGKEITHGADLTGCQKFSLIPQYFTLPQHDIVGVEMIRRFGRGFIRGMGGGIREYVHCVVCKGFRIYIRSTDGTVLITSEDFELYV